MCACALVLKTCYRKIAQTFAYVSLCMQMPTQTCAQPRICICVLVCAYLCVVDSLMVIHRILPFLLNFIAIRHVQYAHACVCKYEKLRIEPNLHTYVCATKAKYSLFSVN